MIAIEAFAPKHSLVMTTLLFLSLLLALHPASGAPVAGSVVASEKRVRSPAQRKIDPQLLYAIYLRRGQAAERGVPAGAPRVQFDRKGRAARS